MRQKAKKEYTAMVTTCGDSEGGREAARALAAQ